MIRLENVTFSYPHAPPALDRLSLDLGEEEHVALIGPNGSGKTTLARCLNGLLVPQRGSVEIDGISTSREEQLSRVRATVGMVFQNPDDQLVATSVETEIAFGLENLGVPRSVMRERVDLALREFGLEKYRRHAPHRLSGGEKQRVAVAAAMVLRPSYLVLDEPTALLDPESRRHVLALLYDLPLRYRTTLIHITQDPEEAAAARRLIVLAGGRVLADAPPEEVFKDAAWLKDLGLDLPFSIALEQTLQERGVTMTSISAGRAPVGQSPARWRQRPGGDAGETLHLSHRDISPETKLRTEGLVYTYDRGLPTQQPGLCGVSMSVRRGSVVGLVGTSGSGKTTLAQHLNGLLKPDQGRVLLDETDIWQLPLPQVRQRVGLVFQFPELQLFAETVTADVAYGPRNLGWNEDEVKDAVERALEAVGLPQSRFGDRPPLALSGGERRRAALAGILAMEPEVLVLDEPTAGLDPGSCATMRAIFTRLAENGTSLILISHDMDLVARITDHLVVLAQGRVLMQGETRAVLADPGFVTRSGLELPSALRWARSVLGEDVAMRHAPLTLEELADLLTHMVEGDSLPPGHDLRNAP